MPRIDILLATFNGARFLEEQLTSVLDQGVPDTRILIRDDGSTDETLAIIDRFAILYPGVVQPMRDDSGNLGVIGNFGALIEVSNAPYIMFCDQDDRWLPGKIADTLAKMREAEAAAAPGTPILVHTDVIVADANAKPIAWSYYAYLGVDESRRDLKTIMMVNRVIGCTAMLNRALIDGARPIPAVAKMHDWWFALYASALGEIHFVPRSTMLYRQHGANQLGARPQDLSRVFKISLSRLAGVTREMRRAITQAAEFADRFGAKLNPGQRRLLQRYADIPNQGWLKRRVTATRLGYAKSGMVRAAMFYLLV